MAANPVARSTLVRATLIFDDSAGPQAFQKSGSVMFGRDSRRPLGDSSGLRHILKLFRYLNQAF